MSKKIPLPYPVGVWLEVCKSSKAPDELFYVGTPAGHWLYNGNVKPDPERVQTLMQAYLDGWVKEPVKPIVKYAVKVYAVDLPAVWYRKRDDGTLSFLQGDPRQPATEFTMAEIKLYHLENCEREEVMNDGSN